MTGCRHLHIVIVGSHETGASSASCTDCKAPLTRRIEGGEYVYVARDENDDVEVVYGQAGGRPERGGAPSSLPTAVARYRGTR